MYYVHYSTVTKITDYNNQVLIEEYLCSITIEINTFDVSGRGMGDPKHAAWKWSIKAKCAVITSFSVRNLAEPTQEQKCQATDIARSILIAIQKQKFHFLTNFGVCSHKWLEF